MWFNKTSNERFLPNSEYVLALQDALKMKYTETKLKMFEMNILYRAYYDYKTEAKLLPIFAYCIFLNPKQMMQSDFPIKSSPKWLLLYRIEDFLTTWLVIIQKVGTDYMPCVQRIPNRPVISQGWDDDLTVIHFDNFQSDS